MEDEEEAGRLIGTILVLTGPSSVPVAVPYEVVATLTTASIEPLTGVTILFYKDSTYIGSAVTGAGGIARKTTSISTVGLRTITANFAGDAYYSASGDSIIVEAVIGAPSTASITFSMQKTDATPISANVWLGNGSTFEDSGSEVAFNGVPAGDYIYHIEASGYGDVEDPITLSAGASYFKVIVMETLAVEYTLLVTVSGSGSTIPAADGSAYYPAGQSIELEAFPGDGWEAAYWLVNSVQHVENPYTFSIIQDTFAIAVFNEIGELPPPPPGGVSILDRFMGFKGHPTLERLMLAGVTVGLMFGLISRLKPRKLDQD